MFDESPSPSTSSEEQEEGIIGKDITNHSANSNPTTTIAYLTEDEDEDELESTMPDDATQNKNVIENIAEVNDAVPSFLVIEKEPLMIWDKWLSMA
eukprot:3837010-Ditylum_brightwellii.AAC.2